MQKKSLFITLCSVVAVVMLTTQCFCRVKGSSSAQTKSFRGIIYDRNGRILVADDIATASDSAETSIRRFYLNPIATQLLGYVEKASPADIDDGYFPGEAVGKAGVERYYDKVLRGNSIYGKNLKLTIDSKLQRMGENLLDGKVGSIVAIEPSTGEVLCMVSSDSVKSMYNRCIMAQYFPGDVFMIAQDLVFMSEGIITPETRYPCEREFMYEGMHIGCHNHPSSLTLTEALGTACKVYTCHGFLDMMGNEKYGTLQNALERWREYMTSLGFGNKLGIDLPHEKRGIIPNTNFYDIAYTFKWSGLTLLSNALGQGVIQTTPLQLANLSATIANRGHYYIPHVVKEIQGETIDKKYTSAQYTKVSQNAYDAIINSMRPSVFSGTGKELSEDLVKSWSFSGMASSGKVDNSVFIGFAPVDNPKIAIAVYIENVSHGNKYATPIGKYAMEKYLTEISMYKSE